MNGAPLPVHHVVLIGFMGTGKSTVGRVLAKELDRDFVDTDAAIERDAQKDIAHIFDEDGEDQHFLQKKRAKEHWWSGYKRP